MDTDFESLPEDLARICNLLKSELRGFAKPRQATVDELMEYVQHLDYRRLRSPHQAERKLALLVICYFICQLRKKLSLSKLEASNLHEREILKVFGPFVSSQQHVFLSFTKPIELDQVSSQVTLEEAGSEKNPVILHYLQRYDNSQAAYCAQSITADIMFQIFAEPLALLQFAPDPVSSYIFFSRTQPSSGACNSLEFKFCCVDEWRERSTSKPLKFAHEIQRINSLLATPASSSPSPQTAARWNSDKRQTPSAAEKSLVTDRYSTVRALNSILRTHRKLAELGIFAGRLPGQDRKAKVSPFSSFRVISKTVFPNKSPYDPPKAQSSPQVEPVKPAFRIRSSSFFISDPREALHPPGSKPPDPQPADSSTSQQHKTGQRREQQFTRPNLTSLTSTLARKAAKVDTKSRVCPATISDKFSVFASDNSEDSKLPEERFRPRKDSFSFFYRKSRHE